MILWNWVQRHIYAYVDDCTFSFTYAREEPPCCTWPTTVWQRYTPRDMHLGFPLLLKKKKTYQTTWTISPNNPVNGWTTAGHEILGVKCNSQMTMVSHVQDLVVKEEWKLTALGGISWQLESKSCITLCVAQVRSLPKYVSLWWPAHPPPHLCPGPGGGAN